nr:neuropeptides B/W receptor type like [Tanacetum cinerariifolium]
KFLFVDQYHGHVQRFSKDYVLKIDEAKRALVIWFLPCLILKIAREVVRMIYMHHKSWWQSFGVLITLTVSWTYVTVIFLSSCLVFHLVSSIAQVVGVILCLNAAAKISHRAQGIAALASRWHALASCGPDD